jgi:hypothetical protein
LAWVTGGSQRFNIHESWWVQDSPGTFPTHSVVLCIEFFSFSSEREKEKRREKPLSRGPSWKPAATAPWLLGNFVL